MYKKLIAALRHVHLFT